MPDCGKCGRPLPAKFTSCPDCGAQYKHREREAQLELDHPEPTRSPDDASVPVVHRSHREPAR